MALRGRGINPVLEVLNEDKVCVCVCCVWLGEGMGNKKSWLLLIENKLYYEFRNIMLSF